MTRGWAAVITDSDRLRGQFMDRTGISIALAMFVLVQPAFAQAKVTERVAAPYAPAGYVMERMQDCRIASSGGAPDARLQCAPGLGWRLVSEDGAVVYPRQGYLRDDADRAFAGSSVVIFSSLGELTRVELPGGASSSLGRGNLKQLGDGQGLPFSAVVWKTGEAARPLQLDGTLGAEIAGADMREAASWLNDVCGRAVVLMLIGAERIPNTAWTEIRRAAPSSGSVCDRAMNSKMAGRGADGKWWAIDPSTFRAKGGAGVATAEEALAWK
jgi:hypothetical protein